MNRDLNEYRILIWTHDTKGLIFRLSQVIYDHNLTIEQNAEFVDQDQQRFFMRSVVCGQCDQDRLFNDLASVLTPDSFIDIVKKTKKDIVIFATKESHVLGDLLLRAYRGELNATIKAVIANHDDLRSLVEKFNIDFHFISADGLKKTDHEMRIIEVLDQYTFECIVLAKYMRILTPTFVKRYPNRILNIHHSFLPAFIGANPYQQAFDRGVKIIGATAHYVTDDLDEGPIISQSVTSTDHSYTVEKMRKEGSRIETVVLSNALDLVLDDRVFVDGNKTVIL